MLDVGRWLILAGLGVTVLGLAVYGLGRAGFRGLPGDIRYESDSFRFYFPIVTCIVLSVLLTLGAWIWRWFSGR